MRPWLIFLMVSSACGFPRPQDVPDDSGTHPDAAGCYGSFVPICFLNIPAALVALTENTDIDTDASPICDQQNNQILHYCVVAGAGFTSTKKISAHGSKPLVLLSTSTMVLAGEVDVSSNHTGFQPRGAGADPLLCTNTMLATGTSGGFGGSFGGKGGDGEQTDGTGGIGAPALTSFPTVLRGGCPGGAGSPIGTGGAGGSGGGAVAIIAPELRLDARINASGAGGRGGPASKSGGGGGGSGGMIVLDTPSIVLEANGLLFANGGGGGQGGAGPGSGDDGSESTEPSTRASGGFNANQDGGFGGPGSAGSARTIGGNAVGNVTGNGGGGAGGGGAGFIHAHGVTGTIIAPPSIDP